MIFVIIFVILFIVIGYSPWVIRRYDLSSSKINHLKIVVMSDLHGTFYNHKLFDLINEEKPDMVLFCGDMIDERHSYKAFEHILKQIHYQMYFVFGNHELYRHDIEKIKLLLRKYNVHIIGQNHDICNHTYIAGMDDYILFDSPDEFHYYFQEVNDGIGNHYSILMSHRPCLVDYYKNSDFDLVICGHAHGGQWRIPGVLNGLYAPDENLFPKYAGGAYKLNNHTTMIVSRGMVKNIIPRFFNPPELVIIEVNK